MYFFIIVKFKINKKVKLLRIGYLIFVLVFITKTKKKRLQQRKLWKIEKRKKSGYQDYKLTPIYMNKASF